MVRREIYLQKLRSLKDTDLIKVVTGIRRCGKSTLLFQFKDELLNMGIKQECIQFYNFEEKENQIYPKWEDLYDSIMARCVPNTKNYIFLDEIQLVENFEKLADALYVKKNVDLYLTGSNANLLSSELATLLSGRYIAVHLLPFSFVEYCSNLGITSPSDRDFRKYFNSSSLPGAVNLMSVSEESVNDYVRSVFDTVIIKDIVKRHKIHKPNELRRICTFIFDNIGNIVSPNNITEQLNKQSPKRLSHNTVIKYIEYLKEAYLIYQAGRYDIKGKELLNTNPKYYVVDLGFKNILQSNKYDADLGHKLENVVYLELLRRGGEVFVGKGEGNEVDFIVLKPNGEREYYQVALTVNDEKTLNRELSSLYKIKDAYPKYLITTDWETANIDGIKRLNILDWLEI